MKSEWLAETFRQLKVWRKKEVLIFCIIFVSGTHSFRDERIRTGMETEVREPGKRLHAAINITNLPEIFICKMKKLLKKLNFYQPVFGGFVFWRKQEYTLWQYIITVGVINVTWNFWLWQAAPKTCFKQTRKIAALWSAFSSSCGGLQPSAAIVGPFRPT